MQQRTSVQWKRVTENKALLGTASKTIGELVTVTAQDLVAENLFDGVSNPKVGDDVTVAGVTKRFT